MTSRSGLIWKADRDQVTKLGSRGPNLGPGPSIFICGHSSSSAGYLLGLGPYLSLGAKLLSQTRIISIGHVLFILDSSYDLT
nr:hypothetical protein Iba_chr08dCG13490 [Ipomoea batatas]GMD28659.1 hypothetical protein Iba_chr08eCG9420 [Ipomoea batatas]